MMADLRLFVGEIRDDKIAPAIRGRDPAPSGRRAHAAL